MAAKKKTRRTPVTKKKVTKKVAKKKVTKKTSKASAKSDTEPASGKKKPPLKKDKTFTGVVDVTVSEALAIRLRSIRDARGVDDEAVLMLMVVEAGIDAMDVPVQSQASGNLVGDDDDPYDPEFEDAFQQYTSER